MVNAESLLMLMQGEDVPHKKIVTGTSYFNDYFWPFMRCSLFMTEIISKPAKNMYCMSFHEPERSAPA